MQSQAGKPKVNVAVTASMLGGSDLGRPFVDITAQNRGALPVTIVSVGFDVGGGKKAAIVAPRDVHGAYALPRPLQPGEAVSIVYDFLELARVDAEASVRGAYVTTATGGRYTTRVKGSWIQSWARHAAAWGRERA